MRVFQINAVPYGSTGRIMTQIAQLLEEQGHEALCTTGFTWQKCTYEKHFITSSLPEKTLHMTAARLTGLNGCFSVMATRRLRRRLPLRPQHHRPQRGQALQDPLSRHAERRNRL